MELFKDKENLSNKAMNDISQTRTLTYKLRSQRDFAKHFVNISRYFGSCETVQSSIKNTGNLHIFRNTIREWESEEHQGDLCRPCVSNLGFVNLV